MLIHFNQNQNKDQQSLYETALKQVLFLFEVHGLENNFVHFLACLPDSKKAQDYGKQADDNDICGSFGYAVREPETLNSDAM